MVRLNIAAFAALVTIAPMALAQEAPPQVLGGTYKVEPDHTQVVFSVLHLGFTYYSGLFSHASGSLKFDPSNPAASSLAVTIPVASVYTTSKALTDHLKGPDWFDAARYPDARFVSTRIISEGPESARIEGRLTLHGVTRPEMLNARFVGAGVNPLDHRYTIGFTATALIRRSEFGVKAYVPEIGDEVRLTIAGAFERQS